MSQNVAPWLQGLDDSDTWDTCLPAAVRPSSATHNASSIHSRIPTRNATSRKHSAQTSSTKRRSPLAALPGSTSNSMRQPRPAMNTCHSRSFSGQSDTSVLQYNTVQQRAKSASPIKNETLEWKRRLVQGKVGYGDHTDLFGPSGLENIFAPTRPNESPPKKARASMSWLDRSALVSVPSSPPLLWPTTADDPTLPTGYDSSFQHARRTTVGKDRDSRSAGAGQEQHLEDSFCSNPIGLRTLEEPQIKFSDGDENERPAPARPSAAAFQDNVEGNRTVSGQTDVDDFSPVFISKHTTTNGQVEYKALDSRLVKQFQNQTVELKHPPQHNPTAQAPPLDVQEEATLEPSIFSDGSASESLPAAPDFSLSENLPTGTPPVTTLSHNIQLKRGGYSNNGSFKQRLLSASQSAVSVTEVPETSDVLSPRAAYRQYPPAPSPPPHAVATPANLEPSEPRSRSSGSPLKLFGPHDTFTNNRLLRRMSQLDPNLSAIRSDSLNELTTEANKECDESQQAVSNNSFGSGGLDSHAFSAEITITRASDSDDHGSDRSPGSEIPPPGSKTPFGFRLEDFPIRHDTFKLKRRTVPGRSKAALEDATLNIPIDHLQTTPEDSVDIRITATSTVVKPGDSNGVGKRPCNSPFKAPTPKRRRTLHASELRSSISEVNQSYHSHLQDAISSLKRRDSRRGDEQVVAHCEVLAQRKILRPRNPTPSQQRQEAIEAQIRETTEQFAAQEPEALEAVMEQIESSMASVDPPSVQQQARVVADEVAKFSLRIQKASGEHSERKPSVTTQDFFNEAVMVMRLIREKAGRQSGLGSVAESAHEAISDAREIDLSDDEDNDDGSALRISRPPSREGGSGWRSRNSPQTDARVISHLRRFQEKDDTEFIAQSIESLHVEDEDEQIIAVDEHANIRIKGPMPVRSHQTEYTRSRPSTQHSHQSSAASEGTQNSAATSTGQTLLSRKSENVGTLAPDTVAHLIGEQVGAMIYDKNKQQWVKVKGPQKLRPWDFLEPPSMMTSDDDPFREISDLKVDLQKEEEIRKASIGRRASAATVEVEPTKKELEVVQPSQSQITSDETVLARPITRDSNQSRHAHSSSDPSRYTAFTSSQQQTNETRATSWATEQLEQLARQGKARQQPLAYAAAQAALELAEHHGATRPTMKQHVMDTIHSCSSAPSRCSFSNALAGLKDRPEESIINEETELLSELQDDSMYPPEDCEIEDINSPKLRQPLGNANPPPSTYRGAARQMSLRQRTLMNKFAETELMEQNELSFLASLPGDRMMSLSLSVSRPMSKRQPIGPISNQQSSPTKKYDPSFLLSDLPDFTVHEDDSERPSERALAQRLAQHAAAEVNDRYSLAVKELVKTLTDVKEGEPYWEQLKQLDLRDKSLASIHGLGDFCSSIQSMDVSNNDLGYLNGAPTTIRQLVARSNQLSSLTPWTHLTNLQYLDISGNQLQSLNGLGCLIHLRELQVDDNDIESLDGIRQLDGLLKLRARKNLLSAIDFEGCQLNRLEELDLCENALCSVENVDLLPCLQSLRLDRNALLTSLSVEEDMPRLTQLSLNSCNMRQLDISNMPSLRKLLLDGNALSCVQGIKHAKVMEVLSLRQQKLSAGEDITLLDETVYARTIRLSGNNMRTLRVSKAHLSLQNLELASVGLQELPDDFGLMLPNLTTLNLNFNSIRDVRPLLNIQKLEQLSICGNRLSRLRKNIAALSKIKTLTTLDLRDNPLTQSFYSPLMCASTLTSVVRHVPTQDTLDDDVAAEAAEAERYMFAPANSEQNRIHQSHLDEDTKLRKRVYQLLLGNSCPHIEKLDGQAFDKSGAMIQDRSWERLVELGIVRKSGTVGFKNDDCF